MGQGLGDVCVCGGVGGGRQYVEVEVISVGCQIHFGRTGRFGSSWSREDTLLLEHFMNCFSAESGSQRTLPVSAESQMPSKQNAQSANSTLFEEFTPTVSLYLLKAWGQ